MNNISILIVDDHTLLRETWCTILNSDDRFQVIGDTGTGEEAIQLALLIKPDIILMDINLPGISGIEATYRILEQSPSTKVIVVSLHSEPSYARKMIKTGARGYITKNSSREELCNAIVEVFQGKTYICNEIKDILSSIELIEGESKAKTANLSRRQIEIINYVKQGLTSKEIAEAVNISLKTVEVHRYNILKKLQLRNTAELISYVHKHELDVM